MITFGTYEQNNILKDGKEPIEWMVLDVEGGKALLISRYGLDAKPYHAEYSGISWESCSLREWLNGAFLETAFTEEEREAILTTSVSNGAGQGYRGYYQEEGNNTQDRVFLLSYHEAYDLYFKSDSARIARVTPYAIAQGAYKNGSQNGWWWIRSPGRTPYGAGRVGSGGKLNNSSVNTAVGCVRPAMWIDLER